MGHIIRVYIRKHNQVRAVVPAKSSQASEVIHALKSIHSLATSEFRAGHFLKAGIIETQLAVPSSVSSVTCNRRRIPSAA